MTGRIFVLSSLVAMLICSLTAATVTAQGLDTRYSFDELQKMANDAQVVVRVRAGNPIEVADAARGLDYEVPCDVLEVVKGELNVETFLLRLSSTANELNTVRRAVAGKEFILPLVPIEGLAGSYRLSAKAGFEADTAEGRALLQIVSGRVERKVVTPLRMSVDPLRTPIEFGQPARVSFKLDNPSSERAFFEQAPLEVRDGQLYLAGGGFIRITDNTGVEVMPKESFKPGRHAPEPAMPAIINPEGSFRVDVDLAEHFDFPKPGVYGLSVGLATPSGEILRSTVPLQLVDGTVPADERGHRGRPLPTGGLPGELVVPSPEVYVAGQPVNGLNMLLKPVKSEYAVGEPIKVEIRLTNVDERNQPLHVDIRLERTLMVQVKEQGDSPVVRPFIQRITWNDKATEATMPYALLRPDSFWGKTININSLYGIDTTELLVSRVDPDTLLPNQINYERLGMTLFSFDKPGVYRIDATYFAQPQPANMRIWAGKLMSNHIFIRVVPGSAIGSAPR